MVESRTYCCDVLSGRVEGDVLSTQEVAGAGAACAVDVAGARGENEEGMRVSAAGCGRWRQAGDDGRN